MAEHKYGRGKFVAHTNYVAYMNMIVDHPKYKGMPNARSEDGRIHWQVSSGKTTSFYKNYLARRQWWIGKADELGLPGKDDENDRFTIAARLIHPTGYRVCRLCGQETNVGYFYVNHNFAKKLNKTFPGLEFQKTQDIASVLNQLSTSHSDDEIAEFFGTVFPERKKFFQKFGITKEEPDGATEDTQRVINENCQTLRFKDHGFEGS